MITLNSSWYCSANLYSGEYELEVSHLNKKLKGSCVGICKDCHCYHLIYPTPEQFKEEYGYDYPDNGAVYCLDPTIKNASWHIFNYHWFKENKQRYINDDQNLLCVCACTPFGKPDQFYIYSEKNTMKEITEINHEKNR